MPKISKNIELEEPSMTKEENIFFAKRRLIDSIYASANLEGIGVTFADTIDFMNNINNGNISIDNMFKLRGLTDGWKLVMDSIDREVDLKFIKEVHFEVCKAQGIKPLGEFRQTGVGISGTQWRPKLPSECDYDSELKEIMRNDDALDRTIDLFCWIQRSQMFLDGNKRVANLVANKEMIRNGLGIISVPVDKISSFLTELVKFYESGDNSNIKKFIMDYCIESLPE